MPSPPESWRRPSPDRSPPTPSGTRPTLRGQPWAGGRPPRTSPERSCTSRRTPPGTSPAPSWWWTAAGRRSTGGFPRPSDREDGTRGPPLRPRVHSLPGGLRPGAEGHRGGEVRPGAPGGHAGLRVRRLQHVRIPGRRRPAGLGGGGGGGAPGGRPAPGAGHPARGGHGRRRGRAPHPRRPRRRPHPHDQGPPGGPRQPRGGRRARGHQHRHHPGGLSLRAVLRARPQQPVRQQHRRERRPQRGRSPHHRLRRHDAPRPRPGGRGADGPGFDLTGLIVGSEGTLGIVTRIWVRLLRRRESTVTLLAIFAELDRASEAVTEIIARGVGPVALEMLDRNAIRVVEPFAHAGYPEEAEAVLLIDVEGLSDGLPRAAALVEAVCRAHGATDVRQARTDREREALWLGRKAAFGALGR